MEAMSTSTNTSIGPDADRGGNESHGNADGCGNKTLGEKAAQQPPAGSDIVEEAAPPAPADGERGKPARER